MDYTRLSVPFSHIVSPVTAKSQVVVSATGSFDTGNAWARTPREPNRLPAYVIERDGQVLQLFSPNYYSLYPRMADANPRIIAVALANGGPVVRCGNRCYQPDPDGGALLSQPVPHFYEYCRCEPWHGKLYFEMFPDAQLRSLDRLLRYLLRRFAISHTYDILTPSFTPRLRRGVPGVYLNSGWDKRRSDPHPQPELLNILKNLK